MQEFSYRPRGVCATGIHLQIEEGRVLQVRFDNGCNGNLSGLSRLAAGMPVNEVIERLKGIRCGRKPTSCPDQLSKALEAAINAQAETEHDE
ncbi:MAG TPA: TIGR03905 family TSCPD domain-containing protein [Bacillota bacterium]|nr:TIGR03905 family TSCPD domain-containing protein [Bacillota bacterium]HPT88422.1 TIGR03905 family TSCPD domain-containing protein [Bacillota bacterium]